LANFRLLGEYLPSQFLITEEAQSLGLLFSQNNSCINFDKNIVWVRFWPIFSQNHLVTLVSRHRRHGRSVLFAKLELGRANIVAALMKNTLLRVAAFFPLKLGFSNIEMSKSSQLNLNQGDKIERIFAH
jgi:hypothetical protein